jgi:hypothetical protein
MPRPAHYRAWALSANNHGGNDMKILINAALLSASLAAPVYAQGQGGYAPGVAGADTAAASSAQVKHMRKHHMTNDTSGGTSSIDKSGQSQEGGATTAGAQGSMQGMGAHAPGNTGGTKTGGN